MSVSARASRASKFAQDEKKPERLVRA
jgi:hypothetical protein